MIEVVLVVTTVLFLTITLLPFLPSNHWFCRVWEFPRVQIASLLAINLVLGLVFLDGSLQLVLAIASGVALIYQLSWIFPYTAIAKKQVKKGIVAKDDVSIKIITSNVLMTNRSAHKLLERVTEYQPDVLITLETDQWWEDALEPLNKNYPYRVSRPLDNLYGIHVFSKFEIIDPEVVDIIEKDIPSVHCHLKITDSLKIKCHFLHPAPPSPTENTSSTPRDRELLLIARKIDLRDQPTIVTGDLNDVAWSRTTREFLKVSSLLDPRKGRGFFNTFHADYRFVRWPLDHIFHSEHFNIVDIERVASIDSDHFPLYSELVIHGARKSA